MSKWDDYILEGGPIPAFDLPTVNLPEGFGYPSEEKTQ